MTEARIGRTKHVLSEVEGRSVSDKKRPCKTAGLIPFRGIYSGLKTQPALQNLALHTN